MWIDTHAHLDQQDFNQDLPEVLERAAQASVTTIVVVGTTLETSRAAVALAAEHAPLFAAVGIQPNYCAQAQPGDWEQIVQLAKAPKVVAIGETGLDRYWDYSPFAMQQDYFRKHIELARQLNLPFIVHTRESDPDVLEVLREAHSIAGRLHGVMHSFTGSAETAAEYEKLGLHISFAGMVTFKKSVDLRVVASGITADRILIETDAPYLSPHPLRGRRNEPAHLVHTAACVAEARGESLEQFALQTSKNARELFRLH